MIFKFSRFNNIHINQLIDGLIKAAGCDMYPFLLCNIRNTIKNREKNALSGVCEAVNVSNQNTL